MKRIKISLLRFIDGIYLNQCCKGQKTQFLLGRREILNYVKKYPLENNSFIHETWGEFTKRIRVEILQDPKINFFSAPVMIETMTGFQPFCETEDFVKQIEMIIGKSSCAYLLKEDFVGKPVLSRNCIYKTSPNRLVHAYQLVLGIQYLDNKNNNLLIVTEWGGGFGGLARLYKRQFPSCTYNIIDIPDVCALQYLYLGSIIGFENVIMHDGSSKLKKNAVNLIPNTLVNKYEKDVACDLFVSSWALSESSKEAQDFVVSSSFFSAKNLLIIYQPKSIRHPYSEDLDLICEECSEWVIKTQFPIWLDQCVIQAKLKS